MLGQPSWSHRSLFGTRERVPSPLGLSRPPPPPKERQNAKPESVSATSAFALLFLAKGLTNQRILPLLQDQSTKKHPTQCFVSPLSVLSDADSIPQVAMLTAERGVDDGWLPLIAGGSLMNA